MNMAGLMMMDLWNCVKVLPTDYSEYGGAVKRWSIDEDYPDCSCGCKWWYPLYKGDYKNEHGWNMDWGVCTNPEGQRTGLLTWEHQAGYGCFEKDDEEFDEE